MRIWNLLSSNVVHIGSCLVPSCIRQRKSARQTEEHLLIHLTRIGIEARPQTWTSENVRRREGNEKVTLRKLASLYVQLSEISSIEVWRQTRKQGSVSATYDELNYVVTLKSGITMSRIPILTSTTMIQTAKEKAFEWTGFTWGKLPLLVERLKADTQLNNRLQGFFDLNILSQLRIRALYDDKVDIISNYDSQRMPSRELLICIEDIAKHVISYVSEQNTYRDHQDEMTRQKLFGLRNH